MLLMGNLYLLIMAKPFRVGTALPSLSLKIVFMEAMYEPARNRILATGIYPGNRMGRVGIANTLYMTDPVGINIYTL